MLAGQKARFKERAAQVSDGSFSGDIPLPAVLDLKAAIQELQSRCSDPVLATKLSTIIRVLSELGAMAKLIGPTAANIWQIEAIEERVRAVKAEYSGMKLSGMGQI